MHIGGLWRGSRQRDAQVAGYDADDDDDTVPQLLPGELIG